MNHFKAINLLHLYSQTFHVSILWALSSYSRFCLCLSSRRLLRRVSNHQLLSKSLIQPFLKQPLANVLTSTQTPQKPAQHSQSCQPLPSPAKQTKTRSKTLPKKHCLSFKLFRMTAPITNKPSKSKSQLPIHIFETQSFLPNLLDSYSTTHQTHCCINAPTSNSFRYSTPPSTPWLPLAKSFVAASRPPLAARPAQRQLKPTPQRTC